MALSLSDRRRMLEAMAEDESLKATQRLRALEELGRMEAREAGTGGAPEADEEVPPDPMADLDEVERARAKRRRRAS